MKTATKSVNPSTATVPAPNDDIAMTEQEVFLALCKARKFHAVILADCDASEVRGTAVFMPGAPARVSR